MAKANTRYVRDIQLNMPDEVISYVITDWLNRNGYSSINYNGEPNVFVAGDGFITAKDYVKIFYQNGAFHIESWFKQGKREIGADAPGAYGWAVKSAIKSKIDQFINYLMQQQYIEHTQNGSAQPQPNPMPSQGQPMPQGNVVNVTGYHDDKAATTPLVIGIIICALSVINLIILLSTGYFLAFGWLFIVLAVFGIIQSNKAIKLTDGSSKAKTALVLNIIGCICVALFLILGIASI